MLKQLVKSTVNPAPTFKSKTTNYNSKLPVITLTHVSTNTNVDITIETPTLQRTPAYRNTDLLKRYATQNGTIIRIFHTLKWFYDETNMFNAKKQGLSTYTHTVIFLNFLRKRKLIPFIDPLNLENKEENLQLNQIKTKGRLLICYLKYLASTEFPNNSITMRVDPYNNPNGNEKDSKPVFVEAIYEIKNIARSLTSKKSPDFKELM